MTMNAKPARMLDVQWTIAKAINEDIRLNGLRTPENMSALVAQRLMEDFAIFSVTEDLP
jgi:hypothetical protein